MRSINDSAANDNQMTAQRNDNQITASLNNILQPLQTEDTYKTIENNSEGFFKDKGSKFIALAFPVDSESKVQEYRALLRKKYHDARHHVYAFRIGTKQPIFRSSDDGEPANSSGPPVLGQIKSFGLTNTLIVVVRYFGGTKLGIPGLNDHLMTE